MICGSWETMVRSSAKEIWLIVWMVIWTVGDLRFRRIWRWQVILVIAIGLLWQGIEGALFTVKGLGGMALGVLAWGCSCITKERLGMGDAMVILCLGLYLGGGKSLLAVMWGLFVASAVSMYLLIVEKRSRDHAIPFIPCLLVGYLLAML